MVFILLLILIIIYPIAMVGNWFIDLIEASGMRVSAFIFRAIFNVMMIIFVLFLLVTML